MDNESIKISVIIPVYNVEKYFKQCVDSVINQTYKNIEIILVDDGSPDNCPKMCDDFSKTDSRIKVVHKVNGGLSSARNAGISVATGDYLMFLDSDDFWNDNEAIDGLVNRIQATQADVVCFGYGEYFDSIGQYGKSSDVDGLDDGLWTDENYNLNMVGSGLYTSSACTKAIKTNLIINNSIFFNEGITSEDIDWSARILLNAKSFSIFPKRFYAYRQREDSIVHTIKYENLKMLSENVVRCIKFGEDIKDKNLEDAYFNYVAYQYISFLRVALLCEGDSRTKALVKEMKQYRWLLKYHLNRKVKIVYIFNKLLGYKLMFKALKLYTKVK